MKLKPGDKVQIRKIHEKNGLHYIGPYFGKVGTVDRYLSGSDLFYVDWNDGSNCRYVYTAGNVEKVDIFGIMSIDNEFDKLIKEL